MFTIEVYSKTARKYKVSRTARSRGAAFLALSLAKDPGTKGEPGVARVKDSNGTIIAKRAATGKLSLV